MWAISASTVEQREKDEWKSEKNEWMSEKSKTGWCEKERKVNSSSVTRQLMSVWL